MTESSSESLDDIHVPQPLPSVSVPKTPLSRKNPFGGDSDTKSQRSAPTHDISRPVYDSARREHGTSRHGYDTARHGYDAARSTAETVSSNEVMRPTAVTQTRAQNTQRPSKSSEHLDQHSWHSGSLPRTTSPPVSSTPKMGGKYNIKFYSHFNCM